MTDQQPPTTLPKLIISCTSHGYCEEEFKPLSNQTTSLDHDGEHVDIKWDDIDVRPGAIETTFEIYGVLMASGGVALSIGTSIAANWLYDRFFRQPAKPSNRITLTVERPDGTRVIINAESEEKIKLQLDKIINAKPD